MNKIRSIFFLFFLFLTCFPSRIYAIDFKADEILVKYKRPFSFADRFAFHRQISGKAIDYFEKLQIEVINIGNQQIDQVLKRLEGDPRIVFAEPNYQVSIYETINDPAYIENLQWGLSRIQVKFNNETVWDYSKSNNDVKIAIVDTGIDQDHQDLKEKIIANKNCTDSISFDDYYGHGTHVAGIAAASTNNGVGIAGLGYQARLINAKALGDNGSGYHSWIANCLVWAVDNGAQIINMSLGGNNSKTLEEAVNYAWNKGAVLVAAAGNSNSSTPSYPAAYPNVISVAAIDVKDKKASWSNYGRWVSVAAPGVSIYSTLPNHKNAMKVLNYGYLSGTSMASPFVSGLSALLFNLDGMTNENVKKSILNYADGIAGTGYYWTYGRINAKNSILAVNKKVLISPTVLPTPTLIIVSSPTSFPTVTLMPTSTVTPTAVASPTPTLSSPRARWCSRFPSFCD